MLDDRLGPVCRVELGRDHQSPAAHVQQRAVELLQCPEPVDQLRAPGTHVVEEPGLGDDIDRRQRGSTSEGVSVVRPAVAAGTPLVVEFAPRTDRRHREPRGDALGHAEDVGLDVELIHREHVPGAAESALHLVGDEQDAELVAARAEAVHELLRSRDVPALADHRLDHDRRDLVGTDLGLEQPVEATQRPADLLLLVGHVGIGERRDVDLVREGSVTLAVDRARRRHRQREAGTAVERAVEHDEAPAIGGVLGELDRRLDRLVARRREEERVDRAGRYLGEALGEGLEQIVGVHVGLRMDELLRLLGDGLGHLRMGVAGRRRGDAGGEVEVLVAARIDDVTPVTAHHAQVGHLRPDPGEMRTR